MRRRTIPKAEREMVHSTYGGRCAYCGQPIEYREMQVDRKIPLKKGGADSVENYMPACRTCNHYKSTFSVEDFRYQLSMLTGRLQKGVYIYKLALKHGRIAEIDSPVIFFFEREAECIECPYCGSDNTEEIKFHVEEKPVVKMRCKDCKALWGK